MKGLMQPTQLSISYLFDRAEKYHRNKQIITATATGRERITYGEWADRTRRLGGVLDTLGISQLGRVATFAWNTARHLELYFAAPCSGRVLHTLNIRLFPEQITYIVNHAEDEVIFIDTSIYPLIEPLLSTFTTVKHLVFMYDGKGEVPTSVPGFQVHEYEALLAAASPVQWAAVDENQAASMCYTSGTTGNPKGVCLSRGQLESLTTSLKSSHRF